ncbi:STAS domain-containing protein [Streptomyces sp. NPDC001889]
MSGGESRAPRDQPSPWRGVPFAHRTVFTGDPGARDDRAVVHLSGEVGYDIGDELAAALALCVACRPADIRIDLTEVTLLDSAGLTFLENARNRAARVGVPVTLTGRPPAIVLRLLELTGTPLDAPGAVVPGVPVEETRRPAAGEEVRAAPGGKGRGLMLILAGATVLASFVLDAL